jgi:Spy/CpxP family protein refolding chaperone
MSDHLDPVPAPDASRPPPAKGGRNWLILPTIALAAALTGAAAGSAVSDYNGSAMPIHFMGGHDFDPVRAEERADRMVRHLAIEVDATNEQTDKLRAIMKATVKDLVPLREKIKSARERARQLLTAPTIDRAAIEQLRSEQMANLDAGSRRIAQGLADAADVLSVEQRRKVEEKLDEWRERRAFWRPWHRG